MYRRNRVSPFFCSFYLEVILLILCSAAGYRLWLVCPAVCFRPWVVQEFFFFLWVGGGLFVVFALRLEGVLLVVLVVCPAVCFVCGRYWSFVFVGDGSESLANGIPSSTFPLPHPLFYMCGPSYYCFVQAYHNQYIYTKYEVLVWVFAIIVSAAIRYRGWYGFVPGFILSWFRYPPLPILD